MSETQTGENLECRVVDYHYSFNCKIRGDLVKWDIDKIIERSIGISILFSIIILMTLMVVSWVKIFGVIR